VEGSRQTATASKTWTSGGGGGGGTGSITIVKSTFKNLTDTQFPFALSGPSGTNEFNLDTSPHTATPSSRTFDDLTAGSYTAHETVPAGWLAHRLECSDPDGGTTRDLSTATATIDLDRARASPAPSGM
jgi:hypothetical protein